MQQPAPANERRLLNALMNTFSRQDRAMKGDTYLTILGLYERNLISLQKKNLLTFLIVGSLSSPEEEKAFEEVVGDKFEGRLELQDKEIAE